MKVLTLDSYYREMIEQVINRYKVSPNEFNFLRNESMFYGTGGSYRHYLQELGHNSVLHIMNASIHDIRRSGRLLSRNEFTPYLDAKFTNVPYFISSRLRGIRSISKIIEEERPDVIFIQDLNYLSSNVLTFIKNTYPKILLVGEIASRLPTFKILKSYDLILSSLPNIVAHLRSININSQILKLGFDPRIISYLSEAPKIYDVVFIGSFTNVHSLNLPLLKILSKLDINFKFFGKVDKNTMIKNDLLNNYGGEAWGLDMFQKLRNSRIVVNRHSKLANGYTNNMRIFESTGVGSLLLTENSVNLSDYFTPFKEVIPYDSLDEIPSLVRNLLDNEKKLSEISRNGRIRTIEEHSYRNRSKLLISLVESLF
jgi:spore maturation protein CgeB